MAQRSMFFDSIEGDRIYTANDFAKVFGVIAGRDGVIYGYGDELAVSPGSGMNVTVGTGAVFVQGRMLEVYGEAEVLPVGAADAVSPRIDRVVVRLDLSTSERRVYLAVKQGAPAAEPVPSTLQQDATIWETGLAQVNVGAGAASISAENVTDERTWIGPKQEVCGTSTFAGPAGQAITHNLGHANYSVAITPIADPAGFLGEVWVIKSANAIVVYNSGSATCSFDWRIAEVRV